MCPARQGSNKFQFVVKLNNALQNEKLKNSIILLPDNVCSHLLAATVETAWKILVSGVHRKTSKGQYVLQERRMRCDWRITSQE